MATTYKLTDLLKEAVARRASDLHLIAGTPPLLRVDGELMPVDGAQLTRDDTRDLAFSLLSADQARRFTALRELDCAYAPQALGRFRVNVRWQQGAVSMSARVIPAKIPDAAAIGLNETIYGLTHLMDGLILVTGPAGSGKSTTLACMIEIINTERNAHILTVEDPIEFVYAPRKSVIEQREVGSDTRSFARAVKYSLRQDPDVVLVGEMRDRQTVQAVLSAAETGHLVLSTLHTRGAAESVTRIIDLFPPHQQQQVRLQLASVLRAVLAQMLLPSQHGGRVAAREVLLVNKAVSTLIHDNDIGQIASQMQLGVRTGMQTMRGAVEQLRAADLISDMVAKNRAGDELSEHRYY